MSVEIHVLSDRQLGSIVEWQRAIDGEGFALRLSDEATFTALSSFLPAVASGAAPGFECDHWSLNDLAETCDAIDFGPPADTKSSTACKGSTFRIRTEI